MQYRFLWHSMPSLILVVSSPKISVIVKLKNVIFVSVKSRAAFSQFVLPIVAG